MRSDGGPDTGSMSGPVPFWEVLPNPRASATCHAKGTPGSLINPSSIILTPTTFKGQETLTAWRTKLFQNHLVSSPCAFKPR